MKKTNLKYFEFEFIKALKNLILIYLIIATNVAYSNIEDQILAYYPLNADAIDASINGNDGVINGATAAEDLRALADTALSFDGIDDEVTLPSIGDWGSNLSFSFWAYANSSGFGQPHILIGSRDTGNTATLVNFYISLRESGTMRWIIASNGINSDIESTDLFPTDRWVHVVADWSLDSSSMNLFWDSRLIATGDIGQTPRYLQSDIGVGHFCNGCGSGSNYFDGRIDELRIHSRILELAEISTLAGVTANYPLDASAIDISGNQRNGTEYGVIATTGVYGEMNTAFDFDGVDDLIDIPAFGNWGQEMAISMWFKSNSDSIGEGQVLMGSRNPGTGSTISDFVLILNSNGAYAWKIYSGGTNSQVITADNTVSFDKWTHIAADWSRITGKMRLFLNGDLIGTSNTGANPRYLNNSVGIGNYNIDFDNSRAPFHGQLDQVMVFNRILTQQEILGLADVIYKSNFDS
jgi:hypothetical protein